MRKDIRIGIVTAAGYSEAARYYERLHGLLEAIKKSTDLTPQQKQNLVVMGGESNYLYRIDSEYNLVRVPDEEWLTTDMKDWTAEGIKALLDEAQKGLQDCVDTMNLPATLIRKERAVGIVPTPGRRIPRESLEETVLVVQKMLEVSAIRAAAAREGGGDVAATTEVGGRPRPRGGIPFCAFNGGSDVFIDIGDKSWGVTACQKWFGRRDGVDIRGENTLHVGDQFLSAGSNDFKARSVGTTAWVASPTETVDLLDELADLLDNRVMRDS